ncbi:hypothetical protein AALO_G00290570 [Alosa alosa]|uniref:Uncharacterized protein n=1 Tax=Alosa alosa TaxID=278164 RepID=A0AAV6FLJ6_9TELE|nr:hypothetical protein AALO_G00290570 [Alosa alosa]
MENLYNSFLPNHINVLFSSFCAQRGQQCLHSYPVIGTADLLFSAPFILGSCSQPNSNRQNRATSKSVYVAYTLLQQRRVTKLRKEAASINIPKIYSAVLWSISTAAVSPQMLAWPYSPV